MQKHLTIKPLALILLAITIILPHPAHAKTNNIASVTAGSPITAPGTVEYNDSPKKSPYDLLGRLSDGSAFSTTFGNNGYRVYLSVDGDTTELKNSASAESSGLSLSISHRSSPAGASETLSIKTSIEETLWLADYAGVDAQLSRIPLDLSAYANNPVKSLSAATSSLKRGLYADEQETVNTYEKTIKTAIDNLKPKGELTITDSAAELLEDKETIKEKLALSKDDLSALEDDGENLAIALKATDLPPAETEQSLIENTFVNTSLTVGEYYDLTLTKSLTSTQSLGVVSAASAANSSPSVNTNTAAATNSTTATNATITEITETALPLPESLKTVPRGTSRTYGIIRIHDGRAELLDTELKDDKLYFSSGKFSTYAIAYIDKKSTKTPGAAPTATGAKSTDPLWQSVPDTGTLTNDAENSIANTAIAAIIALLPAAIVIALLRHRRKSQNSQIR